VIPVGIRWRGDRRTRILPQLVGIAIVLLICGHDVLMATPASAASMGAETTIAIAGHGAVSLDQPGDHQTMPHPAECGIGQTWAPAPAAPHFALTTASLGAWMRSLRPPPQVVASEPPPRPPKNVRALLQIFRQ
jgi:hypothetical protein